MNNKNKQLLLVDPPRVLVMMATYNGSRYLRDQINSILAQQDVDVTLFITDDCSIDKTSEICKYYAQAYDNIFFRENTKNQGSTRTFFSMIRDTPIGLFDYYAFSDQDDFWFSDKLIAAVCALKGDLNHPWLYYSALINCSEDLAEIIGGGLEFKEFDAHANSLKTLLCANWGSGNTMVFDQKLFALLKKSIPNDCPRNHDAWVHLVALSCGKTYADLDNSYIARRISGSNQVGTRGFGTMSLKRLKESVRAAICPSERIWVDTARELYERYADDMTLSNRAIVKEYLEAEKHLLSRLQIIADPDYCLPATIDTITMKLRFLLNKN